MMLPVKPSVTATSTSPRGRPRASTLPVKWMGASLSSGQHIQLELGALVLLGADVHQTHPGLRDALHLFHIGAAHEGELQEHLRTAVMVGAGVHQQVTGSGIGNQGADGNAAHAL